MWSASFAKFTVGAVALSLSPIMNDVSEDLNVGIGALGFAGGVYGAAMTIMAFASSPFQDRITRKAAVVSGIGLHAMGLILAAGYSHVFGFVVGFALCGIGAGWLLPALVAWLSDVTAYEKRAATLSRTNMGWAASTLLGVPLVGILTQHFGWRVALLGGVFLWMLVIALVMRLRAPIRPVDQAPAQTRSVRIALPAAPTGLTPILVVTFAAFAGFYGVFPYFGAAMMQATSSGAADVGGLIGYYGAGFLAATLIGSSIDRVGKRIALTVTLAALSITIAALTLIVMLGAWWALAPVLFCWGLLQNLSFTAGSALVSSWPPASRGSALALNQAALSAGMGVGTTAMGLVFAQWGFVAAGAISAAITLAAFAASLMFVRSGNDQ